MTLFPNVMFDVCNECHLQIEKDQFMKKQCPFCGSENVYPKSDWDNHFIECDECGSRGPFLTFEVRPSEEEAINQLIKVWNDRIEIDENRGKE